MVYRGMQYSYTLPSIKDPDDDSYTISVLLGSSKSFTKFRKSTFSINPSIFTIIKEYPVTLILTDNNPTPLSQEYNFTIFVL